MKHGVLIAVAMLSSTAPLAAQSLAELKAEAGLSWEMVACAGLYNIADRIVAEGGSAPTTITGGGELLGIGASMVRTNSFAEDTGTAVDTAARHVTRMTELFTEVYTADPGGFPAVVGWPDRMALCDRYAASVSEMLGAPVE